MKKDEMMKVTFNVPREEYNLYKQNLRKIGKIPTYDFIAYLRSVNKKFEEQTGEEDN